MPKQATYLAALQQTTAREEYNFVKFVGAGKAIVSRKLGIAEAVKAPKYRRRQRPQLLPPPALLPANLIAQME